MKISILYFSLFGLFWYLLTPVFCFSLICFVLYLAVLASRLLVVFVRFGFDVCFALCGKLRLGPQTKHGTLPQPCPTWSIWDGDPIANNWHGTCRRCQWLCPGRYVASSERRLWASRELTPVGFWSPERSGIFTARWDEGLLETIKRARRLRTTTKYSG